MIVTPNLDIQEGRPTFLKRAGHLLLWVVLLSALLYVSLYAYFYATSPADSRTKPVLPESVSLFTDPAEAAFGDCDRMNILLLGIDANYTRQGIMYTKGARSDTILVISLDRAAEFMSVLTIPRDMRVSMGEGLGTDKINAAHALGGPEKAKQVVSDFLGVPIDHYIKLKLKASVQLIDAVGGITLDVEKDMKYDDNWGNLHINLKKGLQRLNGVDAVGYSRFRHDPEGDRGRIRRQQQVMVALVKELKKPTNILKINQLARIVQENVESDMDYRQILALAYVYKNFERDRMATGILNGGDEWAGGYYMIPDEEQKRRLVKRLLVPNPELDPQDISIGIVNASGHRNAGSRLRNILSDKGYHIERIEDAKEEAAFTQLGDFLSNTRARAQLESVVGNLPPVENPKKMHNVDYTIVLGNDFDAESIEEKIRREEKSREEEKNQPAPELDAPTPELETPTPGLETPTPGGF